MFKLNFLIFILFFSYLSLSNDCEISFGDLPVEEQEKIITWLEKSGVQNVRDFLDVKDEIEETLRMPLPAGLFKHYKKFVQEQSNTSLEENRTVEKKLVAENFKSYEDEISEVQEFENETQEWDDSFEEQDFGTLEENLEVKKESSKETQENENLKDNKPSSNSKNKKKEKSEVSKKKEHVTLTEFREIERKEGGFESRRKYQKIIPYLEAKYNKPFPFNPKIVYKKWLKEGESFFEKQIIPPYEVVQRFMIEFKVGSESQYNELKEKIEEAKKVRLPASPRKHFKKRGEWEGADKFYYKPSIEPYVSFERFQEVMKIKGIRKIDYADRRHELAEYGRFPANPYGFYKKEVQEGKKLFEKRPKQPVATLTEFQEVVVNKEGILIRREFLRRRKEINRKYGINLPSYPEKVYNMNWNEITGKSPKQPFSTIEVFREVVVGKEGIRIKRKFLRERNEINRKHGTNLPSNPDQVYNMSWNEIIGESK